MAQHAAGPDIHQHHAVGTAPRKLHRNPIDSCRGACDAGANWLIQCNTGNWRRSGRHTFCEHDE